MTKEELESKFEDCFDDNTRSSEGGYGPDVTDKRGMWWAFEPVISEYAKQQVISFTNWTTSAECEYSCSDEDQWNNIHNPHESITTEQLYEKYTQRNDNQFIEQQNKDNDR